MKLAASTIAPYSSPAEHFRDELDWLDLLLAGHVAWLRASGQFNEDPLRGLYVTDAEVSAQFLPVRDQPESDHRAAMRRAAVDARLAACGDFPIPTIARRFGLDAFETHCLLLAAACAVDPRYEAILGYAQNDVSKKSPTVGLALSLFGEDDRLGRLNSFASSSGLMRADLFHFAAADSDKPLVLRGLAMDERVAFALLGIGRGVDGRLASFARVAAAPLVPWQDADLRDRALSLLASGKTLLLEGPDDCGQRQLAHAVSERLGRGVLLADLSHPSATALEAPLTGKLLAREALLENAVLLLAAEDRAQDGRHEAIVSAAVRTGATVIATAPSGAFSPRGIGHSCARLAMPPVTAFQRSAWWREALKLADVPSRPELPSRLGLGLCSGPDAIEIVACSLPAGKAVEHAEAVSAARVAARVDIPALAERVPPRWGWEDLVLPRPQIERLKAIAAELDHGARVLHDWGFGTKGAARQNSVVLFSGASGTGKTMAASVIAGALGLDLYRVNLALMFDKYIGETEKNMERMLAAMEAANVVVFLDEADVVCGARTEMKDSHDRYANLSVAYLLQRIETYEGLVVLATNLANNIDEAFARRLRHAVHFPQPDQRMREKLWRLAFPAEAPLGEDLDLPSLAARFDLTGGNIRNAALACAYLAAAEGSEICRRHAMKAVARELEKIGRPPTRDDFGEFFPLLGTEGG